MTCTCTRLLETTTTFCGQCGRRNTKQDSLVGTILDGRYQLDAKIAAGGFGTVYRATELETGEQVAIKVLHEQLSHDANVSARFRREAVAMSSLCDAHTITTYELGEHGDGMRFIVMELLEGQSLAERITSGPLPWRAALTIVRDVCSSLAEAHALGIVHRDLKPANIFLAEQPTRDFVKVLDFGIAKIMDGSKMDDGTDLTRVGQMIGTLEYMAPEQLIGSALDKRTDIYTLGIVAYEMITGRRPYADVTGVSGLVIAVMTQTPVPPSALVRTALPPELDGVLLRCLEREASARYADVHELIAAIDHMLERRAEIVTTQRLWQHHSAQLSAQINAQVELMADADDEVTWIGARPMPMLQGQTVPFTVPASDHLVREQVLAAAALAPTPRAWRVAGTGVPGFDAPEARGSERCIASHDSVLALGTATVAALPARYVAFKILMLALLLAVVGLGIGMTFAAFAS